MGSVGRMGIAAKSVLIEGDCTPLCQNRRVVSRPPEIIGRSVDLILKQPGLCRPADILSSIRLHEGYGTVILIIVDTGSAQFITYDRLIHMPDEDTAVQYPPARTFPASRWGQP